jgi:monoamine oxidase
MRLYSSLLRQFRPQAFALNRRDFIAGLAATALFSGRLAQAASAPAKGTRVLVIGAGFAGLASAFELRGMGYDVEILEARNRVSGRVLTFRDWIPGKLVEGGAELIGSNHLAWLSYAAHFGLSYRDITEWPEVSAPILLGDKLLTEAEKKQVFEELDRAYGALTNMARAVDADSPWNTPNAAQLDARSLSDFMLDQHLSPLSLEAVRVQFGGLNGVPIEKQGLLAVLSQIKGGGLERYWTDTELFRCRQGNDRLATELAQAVGRERIHLATPAVEVAVTDAGVRVTDQHKKVRTADYLVLATPPSTWGDITFSPALPKKLMPQMGLNLKFLSRLSHEVWRPASPYATSSGIVTETWDGTDRQPQSGDLCLVGFSGGDAAAAATQHYKQSGAKDFVALLTELYPEFRSRFVDSRFMNWPGEQWTKAGYSCASAGEITTIGKTLYEGLGRLHFAGEHACYAFAGYMEGALQSGARVAKTIAASHSG